MPLVSFALTDHYGNRQQPVGQTVEPDQLLKASIEHTVPARWEGQAAVRLAKPLFVSRCRSFGVYMPRDREESCHEWPGSRWLAT